MQTRIMFPMLLLFGIAFSLLISCKSDDNKIHIDYITVYDIIIQNDSDEEITMYGYYDRVVDNHGLQYETVKDSLTINLNAGGKYEETIEIGLTHVPESFISLDSLAVIMPSGVYMYRMSDIHPEYVNPYNLLDLRNYDKEMIREKFHYSYTYLITETYGK